MAGIGLWGGIFAIVIGLIYLAVAKGLADGNNGSRLIVAIVSIISIVGGVSVPSVSPDEPDTADGHRCSGAWSSC